MVFLQKTPLSGEQTVAVVRRRRGLVLRGLGDGFHCVVRQRFVSTPLAQIRCSPLPHTRNLWMAAKLARPFIHPLPLHQIPPTNCSGGRTVRGGSVEAPSCVRGVRAEGCNGAGGAGRGGKTAAAPPRRSKRQRHGTGSPRRRRKVRESFMLLELPHGLTERSQGRTLALICNELMIAPMSNI